MIERKCRKVRCEHVGVELGDVQQGVEQFIHRGHGSIDARDDVRAFDGIHVAVELSDEQPQRMQRLSQIVAGRCEKSGFGEVGELQLMCAFVDLALECRVGLLQLRSHAVELIAQRFELVAGRNRDAMTERAGADAGGARLQRESAAPSCGPERRSRSPG